jgi:hypothetical protein
MISWMVRRTVLTVFRTIFHELCGTISCFVRDTDLGNFNVGFYEVDLLRQPILTITTITL